MNWKAARRRMKNCTIGDYLKGIYINKYTLAGYASAATCLGVAFAVEWKDCNMQQLAFYGLSEAATGMSSVLTLFQTALGIPTMITYNRTRTQLNRYGYLKKSFNKLYDHYCDEAAIDFAVKEYAAKNKVEKSELECVVDDNSFL